MAVRWRIWPDMDQQRRICSCSGLSPPLISGSCASSLIYFSLKQTRRQLESSSAVADDLDGELELQPDLAVKHARGGGARGAR
jgi:hypothetical protein